MKLKFWKREAEATAVESPPEAELPLPRDVLSEAQRKAREALEQEYAKKEQ